MQTVKWFTEVRNQVTFILLAKENACEICHSLGKIQVRKAAKSLIFLSAFLRIGLNRSPICTVRHHWLICVCFEGNYSSNSKSARGKIVTLFAENRFRRKHFSCTRIFCGAFCVENLFSAKMFSAKSILTIILPSPESTNRRNLGFESSTLDFPRVGA